MFDEKSLSNASSIAKLGQECATLTSYLPKPYPTIGKECAEMIFKELSQDKTIPYDDRIYIATHIKDIVKHSQNQKNVMSISEKYLSSPLSGHQKPIDEDWFDLFLEECKTVSNEELQEIWGRILAEECMNPNSIRKSLLPILKIMDSNSAKAFEKINNFTIKLECGNTTYDNIICLFIRSLPDEIDLDDIDELESLGLISRSSLFRCFSFEEEEKNEEYSIIYYHDTRIKTKLINHSINIGNIAFTPNGTALSRIINSCKSNEFIDYILSNIDKQHEPTIM